MQPKVLVGILKGRNHMENLGISGKIIHGGYFMATSWHTLSGMWLFTTLVAAFPFQSAAVIMSLQPTLYSEVYLFTLQEILKCSPLAQIHSITHYYFKIESNSTTSTRNIIQIRPAVLHLKRVVTEGQTDTVSLYVFISCTFWKENTISNVAYGTLVRSSVTDICYHMFTNYREAQNSPFLYNIVYSSFVIL
jgi:hypothetical protein